MLRKSDSAVSSNKNYYAFTPKKGYYYLPCTVHAENGMSDFVITESISALLKVKHADYENEALKNFFKNNTQSVIYLSISIACCVGIILLLTIKPKNKETTSINEEV